MTKIKVQKVGVLILLSYFLQGCILTDEFKESLINENKKAQKALIAKNQDMQQAQKLEQLESSISELIEFKPQIVRVIQLEQDLAFLAESLKNMQGINRSNFLPNAPERGLQSSLEAVVEKKREQDPLLLDGNDLPPELQKITGANLLAKPDVTTSTVEISSAQPLMENRGVQPISNSVVDAKFSNLQLNNDNQSRKIETLAINTIPQVGPNKFSSNLPKVNNGWNEDCKLALPPSGVFSIHLASYSNLQNAKEGWEKMSKKYDNDLCGLKPVLANVNVAGKEYLSLRVGPFSSAQDADRLCDVIRATGDYCAQAKYEGRSL